MTAPEGATRVTVWLAVLHASIPTHLLVASFIFLRFRLRRSLSLNNFIPGAHVPPPQSRIVEEDGVYFEVFRVSR